MSFIFLENAIPWDVILNVYLSKVILLLPARKLTTSTYFIIFSVLTIIEYYQISTTKEDGYERFAILKSVFYFIVRWMCENCIFTITTSVDYLLPQA